ncbi:MAG: hypothetical protein Q3M24_13965 [Candidatus Electrothrix aestuarii]|uniref:Uncharacterized protein n=1 Tax=Candidatus Electrothrix aestuarii TaxID=3062594 RepID=A0AAU8LQC9_9BACT|nr:hypothetical protein [Candidatus Electrothrix aestuarii]
MRSEYDFTGGVRGKHHRAMQTGYSITVHQEEEPDKEEVAAVLTCAQKVLKAIPGTVAQRPYLWGSCWARP